MASNCITSSLFPRRRSSSWSLFPLVSPSSLKLAAQVNAKLENYCHILLVSPNLSYHILGNYQKQWSKVAVKNDVSGTAIIQIAYLSTIDILSTMTLPQISVELGQKNDWWLTTATCQANYATGGTRGTSPSWGVDDQHGCLDTSSTSYFTRKDEIQHHHRSLHPVIVSEIFHMTCQSK